jgi:hypothetical protein
VAHVIPELSTERTRQHLKVAHRGGRDAGVGQSCVTGTVSASRHRRRGRHQQQVLGRPLRGAPAVSAGVRQQPSPRAMILIERVEALEAPVGAEDGDRPGN